MQQFLQCNRIDLKLNKKGMEEIKMQRLRAQDKQVNIDTTDKYKSSGYRHTSTLVKRETSGASVMFMWKNMVSNSGNFKYTCLWDLTGNQTQTPPHFYISSTCCTLSVVFLLLAAPTNWRCTQLSHNVSWIFWQWSVILADDSSTVEAVGQNDQNTESTRPLLT